MKVMGERQCSLRLCKKFRALYLSNDWLRKAHEHPLRVVTDRSEGVTDSSIAKRPRIRFLPSMHVDISNVVAQLYTSYQRCLLVTWPHIGSPYTFTGGWVPSSGMQFRQTEL